MGNRLLFLAAIYFIIFFTCITSEKSPLNLIIKPIHWKIQSSDKIMSDGKKISSQDFNPDGWYPASVPNTVLAILVENKVYPDPYYGLDLKSIPGFREGRWLAMDKNSPFYPNWWYRTEFDIPNTFNQKHLSLHLDGINYKANIWLNGNLIADSNQVIGMFRRFQFDITDRVKIEQKNILAIEISAPGKLPDIKYQTKQLEATTGWDDHNPQPPDLNMGIWRKVYISATNGVSIQHPYVVTDLDLPSLDKAHLTVSAYVTNSSSREILAELIGEIEDINFTQTVQLSAGETKLVKFSPQKYPQLTIQNPRLWWPHPVGEQELYKLNLKVSLGQIVSDEETVTFGIREVSTYLNPEGWRGYQVNGKNILIRGGAWMTCDMLLRLEAKRYEALIRYAREANLNMLRSEGFSIRETDEFYDLCDRYGVMVTQQIFGRNLPDEQLSVQNIQDMILRIRNHPSLVHFLGHDETFPTPTLDSAYKDLIATYTPERTYQPHSGAFDINDRFQTGGTRTGTLELWTYGNPAHYYTHKADGAWGFAQSGGIGGIFAPLESMKKMMPENKIWPPWNATFSFHTVLQGVEYFTELFDAIKFRYGDIKNLYDFARKGQAINYECARGMFEAYGRNKFNALGITTWKYDAAWPAALTWQYVDWYLNAGGAYYGAKKACEPLHLQYSYDDSSIYVINNYYEDFDRLEVSAKVLDFNLQEKFYRQVKVNVTENGKTQALKVSLPSDLTPSYFLSLKLKKNSGEEISDNFYWLSTSPDLFEEKAEIPIGTTDWHRFIATPESYADFTLLETLPAVKLESNYHVQEENGENVLTARINNPSPNLAFLIQLAVTRGEQGEEIHPIYWDDNYFCLLPGENKTIKGYFAREDLKGKRAVLKIGGWNIE
jgi:exo-1,4-beta-D-glucosaminidase